MQNTKKELERLVLKQEILDQINNDQVLQAKVATLLDIRITSLYRIKRNNHPRLTQASVLNLLKEELGYDNAEDMLEPEISYPDNNDNISI